MASRVSESMSMVVGVARLWMGSLGVPSPDAPWTEPDPCPLVWLVPSPSDKQFVDPADKFWEARHPGWRGALGPGWGAQLASLGRARPKGRVTAPQFTGHNLKFQSHPGKPGRLIELVSSPTGVRG